MNLFFKLLSLYWRELKFIIVILIEWLLCVDLNQTFIGMDIEFVRGDSQYDRAN